MADTASFDTYRAVAIFLMVLNFPVLVTRLWVRSTMKTIMYDDWLIVLAYVVFVVFCSMVLSSMDYGLGTATATALLAIKLFAIASMISFFSMYFAKISIALVLFRIAAPHTGIRKVIICSLGVLTVWFFVCMLLWGLQCTPFSAMWGEPGVCRGASWTVIDGYLVSAMDITFTFLYAIVPVFMLWNVQISLRTKLGIYFLLGIQVITCVITIVRLKYAVELANLPSDSSTLETIHIEAVAMTYTALDTGLTIFITSMATLKPLLKYVPFLHSKGSTGRSGAARSRTTNLQQSGTFEMGNIIRLDDKNDASGSQDSILATDAFGRHGIQKQVHYEVSYSSAA